MKHEPGQKIEEIYRAALELPEAARLGFLRDACQGDEHLYHEVASLLSQEEEIGRFLEQPQPSEASTARPDLPPPVGFIGQYRIVRLLGEGGMGVVYEAEQQQPRRAVAVKVIRGGQYVSEETVKRFQREAQALALLKHSGIAAIYESGRTTDGQHFFAMELVRGETLSEYARKLTDPAISSSGLRSRVLAFLQISEAVNYAHQRGVIHRDLKPSNILVQQTSLPMGTDSFQGPPIKILDFGLARITDTDVALTTVVTDVGRVQGTLPYMSPEQVRGNPDEIDIRTDVYSLGVVLYELLSGRRPHDLQGAPMHEAARVIVEEEPASLRKTLSSGRLDADLETIVHKALEKEPSRRYQSVSALAEDVRRYLSDEPILARPPSASYQLKKLIARHRAGFAFAASVFLLLAAFGIFMTFQANRLARERDRANRAAQTAEQTASFIVGLFEEADPTRSRGNEIRVREVLDKGAERLENQLQEEPAVRADLQQTLGNVYKVLGLFSKASSLLDSALRTRRAEFGDESLEVADTLISQADLSQWSYLDLKEAQVAAQEAVSIRRKALGDDHLAVAEALRYQGVTSNLRREIGQAEDALREALAIERRQLRDGDLRVAETMTFLGVTLSWGLREIREPEPLLRQSLAVKEETLGPDHPSTLLSRLQLAEHLQRKGDFSEAESTYERNLAFVKSVLGPDHFEVRLHTFLLASVVRRTAGIDKAAEILQGLVGLQVTTGHPFDMAPLMDLALHRRSRGQFAAARTLYEQARLTRMDTSPDRAIIEGELASLLIKLGSVEELEEADRILEKNIPILRPFFEEEITFNGYEGGKGENYAVGWGTSSLPLLIFRRGEIQDALGQKGRAQDYYREAHLLQRSVLGRLLRDYPEAWYLIAKAESFLGTCLLALGNASEAEPFLVDSFADVLKWNGPDDYRTVETRSRIVQLYEELGLPAKAEGWR